MPEQTRASGVTVVLPDHLAVVDAVVDAVPAGGRRTRRRPADPIEAAPSTSAETEAILAALTDQDMAVVDQVGIVPTVEATPASGRRRRGAAAVPASSTVRLAVPLESGEDAVVLLEQDGVYSWRLGTVEQTPARRAGRGRAARPAERQAVFDVDVAARETAAQRRSRGFLGRLLLGPVKAIILKFAARVVVGQVITYLEKDARRGIVQMTGPDPTGWTSIDALDVRRLPTDRPARILLFVHGTFSSTMGSFAALGLTGAGRRLLSSAQSDYDAVIGFDHPTLSEDPLANASDLLRRLNLKDLAHPPVVHAVAYSRGGLVLRSLVEQLLPNERRGAAVERAVFVACTNGGTLLAEPRNWSALLDLYTNIAAAGSRAIALIPGAQIASVILTEAVRGLGAFAKYLVTQAVSPEGVPGLYAMDPGGPFVAAISAEQPGQPGPSATSYYVVSSNFDPRLLGADDRSIPARLASALADGLVDQLMHGTPNDLVVDVPSMSAIDPATGNFVDGRHEFGTDTLVFHSVYFAQEEVADLIAGWLGAPPPATANGGGSRRPQRRPVRFGAGGRASRGGGLGESVPLPQTGPPPKGPSGAMEPAPARTHVLAEMESEVQVGVVTTLTVTISREEVAAATGQASARGVGDLDATRPLIIHVLPKANVRSVGEARVEIAVPAPGQPSQVFFDLEPTDVGPGEVWVIVRQGQVPIMKMTLTPTVVPTRRSGAAVAMLDAAGRAADAPVQDAELTMLRIAETRHGDAVVYEFEVQAPDLGIYDVFHSDPIRGDRQAYVKSLYRRIEDRWLSTRQDESDFEQELRAFGVELLEELVPRELQSILWTHRKRLSGVLATCTEPFIPWELVHLRKPGSRGLPRETAFLGQLGLVRWLFGTWPPERLRIRAGKARFVIPDYPDPDLHLPETEAERAFLTSTFAATAVRPTQKDVRAILSTPGRFDLLHFAGHGLAETDDISDAEILLQGRVENGTYVRDAISASTVAAVANLAGRDSRPIVVLNACQAARQGVELTSIGGFSDAFLDAGAGVFVSSLWSVGDAPARVFVEAFYQQLLAGATVAESTQEARRKAREDGDATWLAYAVYGHPNARLVT